MRILYLADIRFPLERANGIQTMETCHALAGRGHEVRLVVRRAPRGPVLDPWRFYGLARLDGFRIVRRRIPGPPVWRRAAYLSAALATAIGWPRADVVLTRDLGVAALLLRVPRSLRPPVVYESHGFAPRVSGELADLLQGAKRGSPAKQRRLLRRERRVWERAEGYVTITAALAHELASGFGPREVCIAPDGVRLPPARRFVPPRQTDAPTVGYAGHLYPWKGVSVLLGALARLPRARGLIIGGHPGESDLQRLRNEAAALGIADRVSFTGMLPPPDVPGRLAAADILVLPNPGSASAARYTSPLKLFEYMAIGKPIVSSDLPALREVLRDGDNSLLVAPGDPEALAGAIRTLAADPELAARIARTAFDQAARHTWAERAERLEAVLLLAIRGPAGAPAERRQGARRDL